MCDQSTACNPPRRVRHRYNTIIRMHRVTTDLINNSQYCHRSTMCDVTLKHIIYHDFFPPPSRGSHVKSDNTHTIISIHPIDHIPDICPLIFSSFTLFTVYPNSIMKQHPTPLQAITIRAREGGPKEHRAKQNWQRETHSVTCVPGLSTLSDLSSIDTQPPPTFLCRPRPPSHHAPSLTLVSSTRRPLTSAINTLVGIRYSSIISICPNHLNTL